VGGVDWKFPETWDGLTGAEPYRGGGDTWHERLTFDEFIGQGKMKEQNRGRLPTVGRIVHREFSRVSVDGDRAVIEEVCTPSAIPSTTPVIVNVALAEPAGQ
jgi:hypothetical protein